MLIAWTNASIRGGHDGSGAGVACLSVVGRYLNLSIVTERAEPNYASTAFAQGDLASSC